ncbi:LysR substrate-binding domain-containing protein [Paraburkholderia sp.]|uniref:LysR substrate-binding domain-containing protein n=1 Tax=Paraburkholderia sp. TaxID=1926495 RepID=UPI00238B7C09|nr:LysR substrate-binding domain-containing protein [Paraburkholderia sp.]MDE1180877.1 LysR substrate-binding domain-containing protein [Paraburkholderia sp.]
MIELDDMRLFRALGVSRSLAAAARLLNLTPPAVTVRLQRLEERLGVRLAVREARGISLTDEGQRLHQEANELLERIEAIPSRVSGEMGSATGNLRIVAPFGFGRAHIAPLVRDLHRAHPKLTISLALSDSPLTAAAGADVVVSIGNIKASSWVGHYLAPNERYLCASPAFARRLRKLAHPSELAQYECLCLRENDEDVTRLRFMQAETEGQTAARAVTIRMSGALSSNDGTVISDWALDGLGIIERSEWDAARLIASGKLVRVLPAWRLEPAPVMALLPTRHGVSSRQRVFLDAAKQAFDPAPWRREGRG